jgi:hypothetical protein
LERLSSSSECRASISSSPIRKLGDGDEVKRGWRGRQR